MFLSKRRHMVNVFDYIDFRVYLANWYEAKKQLNPVFSYQHIADKAGIKNKGFIYNIIQGSKLLSKSNTYKFSKALGHNRSEAAYFETLVAFNQTSDSGERKHLFEKLNEITNSGKPVSSTQIIRADQYKYFSTWYHVIIRSIIGMHDFCDDYKWLAKMVNPSITVPQAKQSVKLLEKLGLIAKEPEGVYRITSVSISTGRLVTDVAFQNFHLACNDLAKRAFTEFPTDKRNMTGLTLGISVESYGKIIAEIERCQQVIMNIANADDKADRVFQLNFQFFPTSNHLQKRI